MEETQNINSMPKVATITLVQSKATGRYYADRITWCGDPLDGYWEAVPLTVLEVKDILKICGAVLNRGTESR